MAFDFSLQSTDKSQIQFEGTQRFSKILLRDSVTSFYPVAELYFKDSIGIFTELLGYIQGSAWNIFYGDSEQENSSIDFKCVYDDNQLISFYKDYFVSGHVFLRFVHQNLLKDYPKSQSFSKTISAVVKEIINNYSFSESIIETSLNSGIWGQGLIDDKTFILKELLPLAVSGSNKNEPYFCFIDLSNRFHFETLSNMLTKKAVISIHLEQTESSAFSLSKVADMSVFWNSLTNTKSLYNVSFYYIDSDGEVQKDSKKINEMPTRKKGGVGVLQNNLSDASQANLFGYKNQTKNVSEKRLYSDDEYMGWQANFFRQQQGIMILRVILTGNNIIAQSGQCVEVNFKSVDAKNRGLSSEYSGKWVIMDSRHLTDDKMMPFTELKLFRNYVDYDEKNLFKQILA